MAVEIISTVDRRRNWPTEEKLRIMSEALEKGATISAVADRNDVSRSQLYTWLRHAREGKLPGLSMTARKATPFVPVQIAAAPASSADAQAAPRPSVRGRRPALVEVVLTNGRIVKVDETIDPDALARLLAVLDGSRRPQVAER